MLVVGLTGGIGSGKSTVAALFAQLGVPIVDADVIAREVVRAGEPAFKKIVEHFGEIILDAQGNLNRQQLRMLIFQKPKARRWLEQLLHPLIRTEMQRQVELSGTNYCIAVIPLLIEAAPSYQWINRILVVDAPEQLQIERTQLRDQLTNDEVTAILKTQASRAQRLQAANEVIVNDKDLNHLQQQVQRLHDYYQNLASCTA